MSFSTKEKFISFMATSGYNRLSGKSGQTVMYRVYEEGKRVAVYMWNEITRSVDQMVLPIEMLSVLWKEVKTT